MKESGLASNLSNQDSEIQRLQGKLSEWVERYNVLTETFDETKERNELLMSDLSHRDSELKSFKKRLRQAESTVEEMLLSKKSEPTIKLEISALKKDKERLITMLRQTTEFQEFTDFTDDSGGSIRFIESTNKLKKRAWKETIDSVAEMEKENWIPAEAFNLAHDV